MLVIIVCHKNIVNKIHINKIYIIFRKMQNMVLARIHETCLFTSI